MHRRASDIYFTALVVFGLGFISVSCDSTSFSDNPGSTISDSALATDESAATGNAPATASGNENPNAGDNGTKDSTVDTKDQNDDVISAAEVDAVNKLCATLEVQELDETITFAEPQDTCEWGKDDNMELDRANQLIITARREQHNKLKLPKGAIICDMTLDFPRQGMRYDDEIFLLFNNFIMLASQDYTIGKELSRDQNGFVLYNWFDLRGQQYPINNRPQFFIDPDCGTDCQMPRTQTFGQIDFKIKSETVRKLSLASGIRFRDEKNPLGKKDNANHRFSFVTFGDNDDPIDCMHDDFSFDLNVKYVVEK